MHSVFFLCKVDQLFRSTFKRSWTFSRKNFMPTKICLFEDNKYSRLLPLAYFRPVYFLKCVSRSLKEKVEAAYPRLAVDLHCRKYLAGIVRLQNPRLRVNDLTGEKYLFVNGRAIVDEQFAKAVPARAIRNSWRLCRPPVL